jgi:chemotaxis protein MotB
MAMDMEEESGGGIPEWVVTFGDMMSLLLTFFIMLTSLSEIKQEEKYQAMVESITKQFGYDTARESLVPGHSKPRNQMIAKVANDGRAKRMNLMRGGDKAQAPTGDYPRVRIIRPGEKAHSGTVVFFAESSAELDQQAQHDLDEAVKAFSGQPQKIEVRGHTSQKPLPDNSEFANHFELAYARSWHVYNYLTEKKGIDPKRLRMSVAGPYEPMHLTSDPVAIRENPRVEVFMLDEVVSDLMGTKQEQDKRYTDGDLP